MGEYADALIDSIMDGPYPYYGGGPRFEPWRRLATRVTCNRCGTEDLRWKNVSGGGWRTAAKDGSLHICRDFDHISELRGIKK